MPKHPQPEEETTTQESETPEIDAVIVVKTKQPDGAINTEVMTQGNVELTEVQTILELAVRGWRKRIGLVD